MTLAAAPPAVRGLMSAAAVRERAHGLLARAEAGDSAHFRIDLSRLDPSADYVLEVMRDNYPGLAVPYHSRWRHFEAGGLDRWATLSRDLGGDPAERARIRFDLAVTSVLLDAGAGPDWRFTEAEDGRSFARSEGLALASLTMFRSGAFSADPARPLRADAAALSAVDPARIAAGFQAGPDNPLTGLEGRAALLRRLGAALAARPDLFGEAPRVGNLFDRLAAQAAGGRLPAESVLFAVLDGLGPIWPGRIALAGVNLGDVWRHPAVPGEGGTAGLMPFHKLSQWLAYSLVEPLEEAGVAVAGLDSLTGLAEYRNGGLVLDTGLVVPRDPGWLDALHRVDEEAVVEWRALTVALLDRIAGRIRDRLGLDASAMPLARVLEGGTWAAGRRIAALRRPGGGPPLRIASDGTVF